jgi:cytochrome c biogenesis protein CcdA
MNKVSILGFVLYLIFGIYLLNVPFNFIFLPEFISNINDWIIFVGGILIIVGGINYLRANKKSYSNID